MRAAREDLRRERIGRSALTKAGDRDRRFGRGSFGEHVEVHRLALGRGGDDELFEKAAETDGDLPSKGIGFRQDADGVGEQGHHARFAQVYQPWLEVVRVRREDGERERAHPGVGIRRAGGLPGRDRAGGCARGEIARAGGAGCGDDAASDQGEGLTT